MTKTEYNNKSSVWTTDDKLSPLQRQYQRQIWDQRASHQHLNFAMRNFLVWTWIPGRDQADCPDIVPLRDARLMTMDRYPARDINQPDHIALSMYHPLVRDSDGKVIYASPNTIDMFKDFSIAPVPNSRGIVLDSDNKFVFRLALHMDQVMELTARSLLVPDESFNPPEVLLGFAKHFRPSPEWRIPMQKELLKILQPCSKTILKPLLSPEGQITKIDVDGAFRKITFANDDGLIEKKLPTWINLYEFVRVGNEVEANSVIGYLPTSNYTSIKDITDKFPFPALEWIEQQIIDLYLEQLSLTEYRRGEPCLATWNCIPARFVQTQRQMSLRSFLDMRGHKGQVKQKIDHNENRILSFNENRSRIFVKKFEQRPLVGDMQFNDDTDPNLSTWHADLYSMTDDMPWMRHASTRGFE